MSKSSQFPAIRLAASCVLLFLAVCFLLLLNGQTFTNHLVAIMFCAASALLWVPLATKNRPLALWAVLVHVLVIALIAAQLPESYHFQAKVNERAKSR